jgi:xylulokinase
VIDAALGIDAGLTGARAALVGPDGTVLARASLAGDAHPPGEQDPRDWRVAAAGAVQAAVAQAPPPGVRILAITVAAAGCTPILIDGRGEPLVPALLVAHDGRLEAVRRRLEGELGLREGALLDHAAPKLLWWREHEPDLLRRAELALDATGFLVSWLTGKPTMDAITSADYVLPGFAPPVRLPDPADPLGIAGRLTAAAAAALGIEAGVPVTVGTYDSYVDLHSIAGQNGEGSLLLGTTLVLGVDATPGEEPPSDELRASALPGDRHMIGGWTSAAGATLQWADATLGDSPGHETELQALEPGAGGLLALPYLNGERAPIWDAGARGVIVGLRTGTSRAELRRALLDAVALSARDLVERLRDHGLAPSRWRAAGGGVHRAAWAQATSDALAAPIDTLDITSGVAAALFALNAVGQAPAVPVMRSITPDPARTALYDVLLPLYRDLYRRVAETGRALGAIEQRRPGG